jgi:hypothetical protein
MPSPALKAYAPRHSLARAIAAVRLCHLGGFLRFSLLARITRAGLPHARGRYIGIWNYGPVQGITTGIPVFLILR